MDWVGGEVAIGVGDSISWLFCVEVGVIIGL